MLAVRPLNSTKPAVQTGRRIATLRLSVPVALITPTPNND
jgi:hypothetical protein